MVVVVGGEGCCDAHERAGAPGPQRHPVLAEVDSGVGHIDSRERQRAVAFDRAGIRLRAALGAAKKVAPDAGAKIDEVRDNVDKAIGTE